MTINPNTMSFTVALCLVLMIGLSACPTVGGQETFPPIDASTVRLDFSPRHCDVSADGTRAIVWGSKADSRSGGAEQVAVIDLVNVKILVQKPFVTGVFAAAIDDEFVFLIPKPGKLIYRFSRDSLDDSKRLRFGPRFAPRFVKPKLYKLPVQKLGIATGDRDGAFLIIDGKSMEFDLNSPLAIKKAVMRQLPSMPVSDSHLFHGNRIVDIQTGELVAMLQHPGFDFVDLNVNEHDESKSEIIAPALSQRTDKSKRLSMANDIVRHTKYVPKRFGQEQWILEAKIAFSHSFPLSYAIESSWSRRNSEDFWETRLVIRSLANKQILQTHVINAGFNNQFPAKAIKVFGNKAIALSGDRLAVFSLPPVDPSRLATPLFIPWLKVDPWPATEIKKFSIPTKGGGGNKTFELGFEQDHVSIDAATGEITVDSPQLWEQYLSQIKSRAARMDRRRLARYRSGYDKRLHENFNAWYGTDAPAEIIPLTLLIDVIVKDGQDNEDRRAFYVVFFGDRKSLDKVFK